MSKIVHPTDYFQLTGYRKMVLSILRQAAADLMLKPSPKNDPHIRDARKWVNASSAPGGMAVAGISFRDCLSAMGVSSDFDVYQRRTLAEPELVCRAAAHAIEEINVGEGVFVDMKQGRELDLHSTTGLDANWMFNRPEQLPHIPGA